MSRRIAAAITSATLAAGLSIGLAACGGSVSKAPAPAPATKSPAAAKPAAPKATHAPAPLSGPIGTTYVVTGTDDSGNATKYQVTLVQWLPNATGADEFNTAPTGDHLAGAEFRITGVSGNSTDDANNDAQVNGANSQVYQPGLESLASGTNFNNGDFNVAPGVTQVGFVSFEVPNGTSVATVQWSADGFMGSSAPGTWTV
jgi:hypothetical protein